MPVIPKASACVHVEITENHECTLNKIGKREDCFELVFFKFLLEGQTYHRGHDANNNSEKFCLENE